MHRAVFGDTLVIMGCIHNLEKECEVLNKELGDCELEVDGRIVWRCKFFHIETKEITKKVG